MVRVGGWGGAGQGKDFDATMGSGKQGFELAQHVGFDTKHQTQGNFTTSDAHFLLLALPTSDAADPVQAIGCIVFNIWPDGYIYDQAEPGNTAS